MISLHEAKSQIKRMAGLRWYPPTAEAELELIKIAGMARDLDHCKRVIDYFVNAPEAECPSPHALKVEITPPRPELYRVPEKLTCPEGRCNGGGWATEFWLHTQTGMGEARYTRKERITLEQHEELLHKVDWSTQTLHEGVVRCPCAGGTARKAPESQGRTLLRAKGME